VEVATLTRNHKKLDDWFFYIYNLDEIHCSSIAINTEKEDMNLKNSEFINLTLDQLIENAEEI